MNMVWGCWATISSHYWMASSGVHTNLYGHHTCRKVV